MLLILAVAGLTNTISPKGSTTPSADKVFSTVPRLTDSTIIALEFIEVLNNEGKMISISTTKIPIPIGTFNRFSLLVR